mmetsp:Transcript_20810/g.51602  ORF Transcript_20810/g.51602 Transcript_20810/m.51602 type:complete len:213 (-) Transcript_20810:1760-2398(-)
MMKKTFSIHPCNPSMPTRKMLSTTTTDTVATSHSGIPVREPEAFCRCLLLRHPLCRQGVSGGTTTKALAKIQTLLFPIEEAEVDLFRAAAPPCQWRIICKMVAQQMAAPATITTMTITTATITAGTVTTIVSTIATIVTTMITMTGTKTTVEGDPTTTKVMDLHVVAILVGPTASIQSAVSAPSTVPMFHGKAAPCNSRTAGTRIPLGEAVE